jgi:competence protein ComEC
MISNIYFLYINSKYEKFYKSAKDSISLEAVIISGAKESEYNYSYTIKATSKKYKNKKFILYVKKNKSNLLDYGDLVKVEGEFSLGEVQRNYGGFNYREYLKAKKVYGTVFAKDNVNVIDKNKANIFFTISNTIREKITAKSKELLPERTSSLLLGLLIGDTSQITEDMRATFKISSLYHILAVSRVTCNIYSCRSKFSFE